VTGGAVTTAPTTQVQGATTVTDGLLQANGGSFDGGVVVDGGDLAVGAAITANGVTLTDGSVAVGPSATVASDLTVDGGLATLAGTVSGDVTQTDGSVTQSGFVTGDVSVSGGVFEQTAGDIVGISGATEVTGGTLIAGGGSFVGDITNDGGVVELTGNASADLTNESGTMFGRTGSVLNGGVSNAATFVADGGAVVGDFDNAGDLQVSSGGLSVANLTSTGAVTVENGQQLSFATGAFAGGSTLTVNNGVLDGDVTFAEGLAITASDMTVTGDLASLTSFASNGDLVVGGDLTLGAGALTFETGTGSVDGTLSVAEGVTLTLQDDTALTAGALQNAGTLLMGDGVALDAVFDNTGVLTAGGTLSFAGGLSNAGTVSLVNGSTDDLITISGGDLSGGGTLSFDVDLSDASAAADTIVMGQGAFITGDVTLQFNVLGSGGQQATDVLLIDVAAGDPGNFTVTADEIVDPSGILTYSVTRNAAGDVVIEDGLNPGIAGLAGNIVLTQSLIGSVVNRPSSPFVTTLAYEETEDPCGAGMWGRTVSGGAKSSGEIVQSGEDGRPFEGAISAVFAGVQLGGDFACFNGVINGWDLAAGGIGGVNVGVSSQPVFAIDVNSEDNLSDLQTGTTDVDFIQSYAGIYGTAVRGPMAFDLQYRLERTDFTATNVGTRGLPGLGLDDTTFTSMASTLSGAASYVYSIPDSDLVIVPTAGFAYTQISTDPIVFEDRGTVRIDDFDSKIGFIGGTLARSNFGADGVSAYRQFISATFYNDFADGPRSTFSPIDDSGDRGLQTENLGFYSEVSFGINYVRVLQEDEFGPVKQLSLNTRADMRVSPRLQSWGVTAQARFQF